MTQKMARRDLKLKFLVSVLVALMLVLVDIIPIFRCGNRRNWNRAEADLGETSLSETQNADESGETGSTTGDSDVKDPHLELRGREVKDLSDRNDTTHNGAMGTRPSV